MKGGCCGAEELSLHGVISEQYDGSSTTFFEVKN